MATTKTTKASKKTTAPAAVEATATAAAAAAAVTPAEAAAPAAAQIPPTNTTVVEPPAKNTDQFLRQRGLVNMDRLQTIPITIIGAGGIGSGAILALAQMGARDITVYDDDTLEIHNVSNQIYPQTYVGKSKVEAARDFIKFMYDFEIKIHKAKYDGKCKSQVIVSGVDSMESRKAIWELVKAHNECVLYIDARMGALNFNIFNEMMVKTDHESYERSIVADAVTLDLPCTARSIGFNVMVIGGYIASQVRNYLARQKMPPFVAFDMACNTFERLEA